MTRYENEDGGLRRGCCPPSSLSETTVRLLTNEELEPWLASLRRLWYDRDFYDSLREKGLQELGIGNIRMSRIYMNKSF